MSHLKLITFVIFGTSIPRKFQIISGAGDDGAMCAIMLETLRVLSQSDKPLKHPVVFLFNGAEENPLQASHAFITQHKWAKNVK